MNGAFDIAFVFAPCGQACRSPPTAWACITAYGNATTREEGHIEKPWPLYRTTMRKAGSVHYLNCSIPAEPREELDTSDRLNERTIP